MAELTKIEISQLEIRLGFPPKVLATGDDSSLKDAGIAHGGKYQLTIFLLDLCYQVVQYLL